MNQSHHPCLAKAGSRKLIEQRNLKLAVIATFHCLIACGIGEILGLGLATWLDLSMISSTALVILLGFIFGFGLGIVRLIRKNTSFYKALKIVIVAEGLSIVVMQSFEALTQVTIPVVIDEDITNTIFWMGTLISLLVGFMAAFLLNYHLLKKGVRHIH